MNVFYLDQDPKTAAQYHCDSHVVKMCLETAQILSTVKRRWYTQGEVASLGVYRETHVQHPSVFWAGNSTANHNWTLKLFDALLDEYRHRFKREHKCEVMLSVLDSSDRLDLHTRGVPFATPPLAMPIKYQRSHGNKFSNDRSELSALHSYRNYYANGKRHLLNYTNRPRPDWIERYQTGGGTQPMEYIG